MMHGEFGFFGFGFSFVSLLIILFLITGILAFIKYLKS